MSNSGWQKGICLSVPQKPKLYLIHASKTALTRKYKRECGKSHPALNFPSHFTGHNKSHGHDWLQKDRKNQENRIGLFMKNPDSQDPLLVKHSIYSPSYKWNTPVPSLQKINQNSHLVNSIKLKDQIYGWYGKNLSIMSRCGPSLLKPIY